MAVLNEENVRLALKTVKDVSGSGDIVAENRVEKVTIDGNSVMLTLKLPVDDVDTKRRIEDECRTAVKAIPEVAGVMIMTKGPERAAGGHAQEGAKQAHVHQHGQDPMQERAPIEGIKNIIAVSSAKGGVGKSTVCVNLALALQARGAKVGLMDADVYGPSIHLLLDVTDSPRAGKKKEIAPIEKDGLKMMSLGFLTGRGSPVIWRGPMVMGVVKKFLQDVDWGELDFLMIDMPPGTGDAQLTLAQTVPITGAIIVTTPSELALVDAEKGLEMFRSVDSPVLGIIENMSYFVCPHCDEKTAIFGQGGGREISQRLKTEFIGEIPLDVQVRSEGDQGRPIVKVDPDSSVSRVFMEMADTIRKRCPSLA